jgi:heme exporter protein A
MHGRTDRYRDPGCLRTAPLMGRFAAMRLMATNLACVRGGQVVFSGLGFAVEAGQMMAVTGTNGAGKTTLLRLLAELLRLSEGTVMLTGGEPDATLAEQAHYVGHQDALKPALTVGENLEFWARYLGGEAGSLETDIETSFETWGLAALTALPAAYLSAGQRRRLSLCRLAAIRRPVWLLDEPTAALDAAAQETLGGVMAAHLAQGGIIVAATHGPLPIDAAVELRLSSRHAQGRAA